MSIFEYMEREGIARLTWPIPDTHTHASAIQAIPSWQALDQQARELRHDEVHLAMDQETGLRALIGVHSTLRGPALGGTRVWNYDSEEQAIRDVLRLSQGMTAKNAAVDLELGGGKAVIWARPEQKTPALLRVYGRFVDSLGGRYITAEDVGTSVDDMTIVREVTKHVVGLPPHMGGSGDPSPVTAYGLYTGIHAMVKWRFERNVLDGLAVAVQGLGHVGFALAKTLIMDGAEVIATDISELRRQKLRDAVAPRDSGNLRLVEPDDIYDVECDIFSPCALGGVINDDTIPRLCCEIIAGAANNQLDDPPRHANALKERGIDYAVDFVINAGGVINVWAELTAFRAGRPYSRGMAYEKVSNIPRNLFRILEISEQEHISSYAAALTLARGRLDEARTNAG
jgi:leucine dehydrogenase